MMCRQPDRDVPGIVCGYPLPCPWHTVILHADKEPPTMEVPLTVAPDVPKAKTLKRLKDIGRIIAEMNDDL